MRRTHVATLMFAILGASVAVGCARDVVTYRPVVLETRPHDPDSFTQGLVWFEGRFFESSGRYGRSDLREVDAVTGEVVRSRPLAADEFAEGLALVEDRLVQLTYREGVAHVYDRETFEPIGRFRYDGEGWGLCYDGTDLWMSDGSSTLIRRDPTTFEIRGRLAVTRDGRPVTRLNELGCVGDEIYANVWMTTDIVRIVKRHGRVEAVIDASALVPDDPRVRADPDAVLNGIAHDPDEDIFFLTGKLWDVMYVVRFERAP